MNPKARYDWKTSKSVFDIYKEIYSLKEGISLTELAKKKNKSKSTITNKLRALLNENLIIKEFNKQEMEYKINEKKINSFIHYQKNKAPLNLAIDYSKTFNELFNYFSTESPDTENTIELTEKDWITLTTEILKTQNKKLIDLSKEIESKAVKIQPL